MLKLLRNLVILIICPIMMFGAELGIWSCIPIGKEIDLDKFEMVFSDEFDGTELSDYWNGHGYGNVTSIRRGSYWDRKMAQVYDGDLHIKVKYLEDGLDGNGKPGWYTAGIDTKGTHEQKYGYFETRCILPKGLGLWSAFWMYCPGVRNEALSGAEGAEIDIFESAYYDEKVLKNKVSMCIHTRGYGENHESSGAVPCLLLNNPYEEYNTYGMEWNEDGYTFYINGREWYHTDFGTVSEVPEFMILSVEIGGENAVPSDSWAGPSIMENGGNDFETDFIIDYVRTYQYK